MMSGTLLYNIPDTKKLFMNMDFNRKLILNGYLSDFSIVASKVLLFGNS
jgi:hypothetical protein